MDLVQAVPGTVEPQLMVLREAAAKFRTPGTRDVAFQVRRFRHRQRGRADQDILGPLLLHREGKQTQIVADPDLLRSDPDAAAMLRGQAPTGMIAADFPGDAMLKLKLSLERRQGQAAAAQKPNLPFCAHPQCCRSFRFHMEAENRRQTQQQRQPGQSQRNQQRQPGEPLPIGDIEHPAAQGGCQVTQSAPQHISAAGEPG